MAGKKSQNLTGQQRVFVAEYLNGQNGKAAAVRAGYSEKCADVAASRLLAMEKIQKAIAAASNDLRKQFAIEAQDAIEDMIRIRNLIPDEEEVPIYDKKTGRAIETVKVHNAKLLALRTSINQDILDRAGYKPAQHQEHTGKDGGPIETQTKTTIDFSGMTDEELEILERIAAKASRPGTD